MGGIPLPALAVRSPEEIDPLALSQRSQQIRNLTGVNALQPGELQQQQQQIKSTDLDIQQKQLAVQDQQAATAAMREWDGKDPADLVHGILKNGGTAQGVLAMQQHVQGVRAQAAEIAAKDAETNSKNIDTATKLHDRIAGGIEAIIGAPDDQKQALWAAEVAKEEKAGTIQPGSVSTTYPGDDQAKVMANTHKLSSVIAKESVEQQKADTLAKEADLKTKEFAAKLPGGPLEDVSKAEMTDWLKKNPGKGPSEFLPWKAKQAPLANFNLQMAAGGGLKDEARDQAAEKYYTTGVLPPGGRGAAGLAQGRLIMNRAAELHPGGNLAANSAEYKANADSLKKLQGNFDQVSAFENTAGKNLDLFLNQAQKVVDTGIPLINIPARMVTGKMGGPNQAAFDAARTTALTEIAKVLNSSNASGVLSDSARSEVSGLITKDASLKQIVAAANILKQDMANRHQSYQEQIDDIKRRIGGGQPSTNSGGTGQAVKVTDPRGIVHTFPDQASADKFKKAANIQ